MTVSRAPLVLLLLLPCLPACEPASDPPSIAGLSAADATDLIADLTCEHVDRCGVIAVRCVDCDGETDCGGCVAERTAVTYDRCTGELGPEIHSGIACRALTADEEARVDACLAALPEAACPTVDAVEAWANGGGGDDPRDPGPCDVLEELSRRCDDSTEPGPRTPDPLPPE